MPWRIICGFVALFVLTNAQQGGIRRRWESKDGAWKTPPDNLIDIDLETERNNVDQGWQEYEEEMSGSGSGMEDTDDEDFLSSGSGSGGGIPDSSDAGPYTHRPAMTTTTTATTTTSDQLTPCEQLREASQHLLGNYVPRCKEDGKYDSLQCHGHPGSGVCWCADLGGREIPSTARNKSIVPDCDRGSNLPPCVFELVKQSRKEGLGVFRPKCTLEGDYESTQCSGSLCYCVDTKTGAQVSGTEVFSPDRPRCGDSRKPGIDVDDHKVYTTAAPPRTPPAPAPEEEVKTQININIGQKPGDRGTESKTTPGLSNNSGEGSEPMKEPSSVASLMSQPGILAAVVGGCVVFVLCAVLLVMFIVYRMKKKDEGSYALDEPKKLPNYSYQRAPDREFYA